MKQLLFLAHRVPFPPNKGDKIRTFHFLRHLAQRFRVDLGAFWDRPEDEHAGEHLREMCRHLHLEPLRKLPALARSATGLLRQQAFTMAYYRHAGMHRWVQERLRSGEVDRIFAFSGAMGQYVHGADGTPRVICFDDVDSDKWAQYARNQRWPLSAIYAREAHLLAQVERRFADEFTASIMISELEGTLMRELAPSAAARIHVIGQGVDLERFSPDVALAPALPPDGPLVVFTGVMDYLPNVAAVVWFVDSVWPKVIAAHPTGRFAIVGARPTAEVLRLAANPGVIVTGGVEDVRPYTRQAKLVVAPMTIARGVQNKVLEALAMARPVVATPAAVQGLGNADVPGVLLAEEAGDFASAVARVLGDPDAAALGRAGRQFVQTHHSWDVPLRQLEQLLQ
jgi:sugar transferase (PEP-CTERM/EpsH1 system associated)